MAQPTILSSALNCQAGDILIGLMEVTKVAETRLPTPFGIFKLVGFESQDKSEEVLALVMGEPAADDAAWWLARLPLLQQLRHPSASIPAFQFLVSVSSI